MLYSFFLEHVLTGRQELSDTEKKLYESTMKSILLAQNVIILYTINFSTLLSIGRRNLEQVEFNNETLLVVSKITFNNPDVMDMSQQKFYNDTSRMILNNELNETFVSEGLSEIKSPSILIGLNVTKFIFPESEILHEQEQVKNQTYVPDKSNHSIVNLLTTTTVFDTLSSGDPITTMDSHTWNTSDDVPTDFLLTTTSRYIKTTQIVNEPSNSSILTIVIILGSVSVIVLCLCIMCYVCLCFDKDNESEFKQQKNDESLDEVSKSSLFELESKMNVKVDIQSILKEVEDIEEETDESIDEVSKSSFEPESKMNVEVDIQSILKEVEDIEEETDESIDEVSKSSLFKPESKMNFEEDIQSILKEVEDIEEEMSFMLDPNKLQDYIDLEEDSMIKELEENLEIEKLYGQVENIKDINDHDYDHILQNYELNDSILDLPDVDSILDLPDVDVLTIFYESPNQLDVVEKMNQHVDELLKQSDSIIGNLGISLEDHVDDENLNFDILNDDDEENFFGSILDLSDTDQLKRLFAETKKISDQL